MNFLSQPLEFPALHRGRSGLRLSGLILGLLAGVVATTGCSTRRSLQPANSRPFQFETDTFAFANELVWIYYFDEEGHWRHRKNEAKPEYTHRCFVVARTARQFFQHARFDASLPRVEEGTYRQLVQAVISRDPAQSTPDTERIVIPGFANLREFSEAEAALLQETCGGVVQSYTQRGHWRMIFPFSRKGQEQEAEALAAAVRNNRPPVVHVLRFPRLQINHALLLYRVEEQPETFEFTAYDPNHPETPTVLQFDRHTGEFYFPANDYWKGGDLNVYEVYRAWNY